VRVMAPTRVVVGKEYGLSVILVGSGPANVVRPVFKLHHVRTHLKAITDLRVPGRLIDHESTKEDQVELFNSRHGLGIELPINEKVMVEGAFPKRLYAPPTFSTVSVSRRYSLSVHVTVACLEETFNFTCRWPKVELLPAKMEKGAEEAVELVNGGESEVEMGNADAEAVDVAPPAYVESSIVK